MDYMIFNVRMPFLLLIFFYFFYYYFIFCMRMHTRDLGCLIRRTFVESAQNLTLKNSRGGRKSQHVTRSPHPFVDQVQWCLTLAFESELLGCASDSPLVASRLLSHDPPSEQRRQTRSHPLDLREKLWGQEESLRRPADFAMATRLTIQHGNWKAEGEEGP